MGSRIGFIGLGQMGGAIAMNLAQAGHDLTVWNRSQDKAAPLLAAGAKWAASPRALADRDIVVTMLADDRAAEAAVFGAEGLLAGPMPGIHVSMSTISVALSARLDAAHRAHGGSFVAAPVFGRPAAAQAAKLFVVAAGEAGALAACARLFATVAQRTFEVGDSPPAANLIKLCGNFMVMATVEMLAEAMTLAEKGGVSRAQLAELLTGTVFNGAIHQVYGDILVHSRFRPAGFAAPLGLKDMNLVGAAADVTRTPLPMLGILRDHLLAAIAGEGEDIDSSGMALAVRRSAGILA